MLKKIKAYFAKKFTSHIHKRYQDRIDKLEKNNQSYRELLFNCFAHPDRSKRREHQRYVERTIFNKG